MGKSISLIGNPGVGKTTFFLAMLHQLNKVGWAPTDYETLPEVYHEWIEAMGAGQRINPTIKLNEYSLKLRNFEYHGSKVKIGFFGGITMKIRDIKGDDYRRTTETFKESIRGASAVLAVMDPTRDKRDLGSALIGQVSPLVRSLRYICTEEKRIKYVGMIFAKRSLHPHSIKKIRYFIEDQLGPVMSASRRSGLIIRLLEVESRGLYNRLDPWGVEEIVYDFTSHIGKVEGPRYDVTRDPSHDWNVYAKSMKKRKHVGN